MRYFLLLITLWLALPLQAASPVWLVENGGNRLFLAGTVHVLRAKDYPLPAAFDRAYRQSKRLAFETDIAKSQGPSFQQRFLDAIRLPEGQTLQQLLKPKTLTELNAYLQINRLMMEQFAGLKPSMIAITLTIIELKKLGVTSEGVDQYFFQQAKQDGKMTLALESVQQQIHFLAQLGKGQEDQMILQTLDEIDTLPSLFPDMLKAWRQGNQKKMEELFIEPMKKEFELVYQQLLVQRNQNWIPQIIDYLQSPETEMVLVGSAHLVGDDGLLQMLKQKGYRISQLD